LKSPISELVSERYSCRAYIDRPIGEADRETLAAFLESLTTGPFGSQARFALLAATGEDRDSLKGLGTYGFIKDAPGFIVGAVQRAPKDLEDYGYLMESAVLAATDLGLQTCWLGGTFNKSGFARKIGATRGETVPSVTAVGEPTEGSREGWMRQKAGSLRRLAPEQLFFDGTFGRPLELSGAAGAGAGAVADAGADLGADLGAAGAGAGPGAYTAALDAVRWAPSASNKQPWRVLHRDGAWHFYLQRSKDRGRRNVAEVLLRIADLPRVDLGIAMCHFGLVARESGLRGRWVVDAPEPAETGQSGQPGLEYVASWVPGDK
jgi:nitroreductase